MSPTPHLRRSGAATSPDPTPMRIHQATVSPTGQSNALLDTTSITATSTPPSSASPVETTESAMPVNTKLGFAMIPVAIAFSAIVILLAFWLRGRQMRRARRNRTAVSVPTHRGATGEKSNYHTPDISLQLSTKSGKWHYRDFSNPPPPPAYYSPAASSPPPPPAWEANTHNHTIAACRTPRHTPSSSAPSVSPHERVASTESVPIFHIRDASTTPSTHTRWPSHSRSHLPSPTTTMLPTQTSTLFPSLPSPSIQSPQESPIDGTSPFRLKRGNTNKRNTLGSAIASQWPMPAAPAPTRGVGAGAGVRGGNLSEPLGMGRCEFPVLDLEDGTSGFGGAYGYKYGYGRREARSCDQRGWVEVGGEPGPVVRE